MTDAGEEDQQNLEIMLPVMQMPLLQPSLIITEEASLIPETLSLRDHKNVEVKQRNKPTSSIDEDYMGAADIYNSNEIIYSQ